MHYETLMSSISCVCPSKTLYTLAVHVCTHLLQQHVESGWFVIFSQLPMHPLPKMPLSFVLSFAKACAFSVTTPTTRDACNIMLTLLFIYLVEISKTHLLDKIGMGGMTFFTCKGLNAVPWLIYLLGCQLLLNLYFVI